jgi:hypothetical protein
MGLFVVCLRCTWLGLEALNASVPDVAGRSYP